MLKPSLLLSFGLLLSSAAAYGDPIITITPWLAPNTFGSPSFAGAVANEQTALMKGLTTYGAAGPTQFNAQSNITADQAIVTNFSSWMGVAEPGGAYSAELGNRMTFGLAIVGNGAKFSISQLSFTASSTDPGGLLAFGHTAGYYNYTSGYMGVLYGADGVLGGADDTYITSGPSTQLVDALYAQGNGNSFAALCTGCSKADEQAQIAAAASYPGTPFTFTGTYSLVNTTSVGSGTFNVSPYVAPSATPEPSSLVFLGTGIAGMAGALRRRFKK